jgi:hypothetical protein
MMLMRDKARRIEANIAARLIDARQATAGPRVVVVLPLLAKRSSVMLLAHFGRDAGAREVLSIQRHIRAVVAAKVSQTKAGNK